MWAYPFANSDEWWGSGYNASAGAKDYKEMYDVTRYFLTNYNNSGKTFYLGHWEGDGYLKVNNWTTNPSPATIQGMIGWLNNRQKAVDDAKRRHDLHQCQCLQLRRMQSRARCHEQRSQQ